VELATAP